MAEYFSNLEVAPNEHTEQTPELRDHAAHAPEPVAPQESSELDKKVWPLPVSAIEAIGVNMRQEAAADRRNQQSPDSEHPALTPSRPDYKSQYSDDAPETNPPFSPRPETLLSRSDNETLKEAHYPAGSAPEWVGEKKEDKRRRPKFWIIIAIIAVLILAIALGVGLGVGLTRNKKSSPSR